LRPEVLHRQEPLVIRSLHVLELFFLRVG
jgi:hypothetical protein